VEEMARETSKDSDAFEVFPENWTTVCIFRLCQTQWRVAAGMGFMRYLGLDYASVKATLDTLEVQGKPEVFLDLQLMERAALAEFSEIVARKKR